MPSRSLSTLGVLGLVALALWSCGADPAEPGEGGRNPFGHGFQDLFSDMRKVDLGDLVSVSADLATRGVNSQLGSLPYGSIQLSPTQLFALKDQAKNDLTLKDLEGLTAGLAARYGDDDFITHVNALRSRHLRDNPGRLFAEASFRMEGKLGHNFAFEAAGLPGQIGLLASKGIRTTVIAPYKGELRSVLEGPLDAIIATRGFILPESVDHILAMVPGESIGRESDGVVGFNVGIGLPIYLTSLHSAATLHAVISAGARVTLSGELDIQLVRDAGQTAVVDVGVTGQTARSMNVAVETRWGLAGLPTLKLDVGPLSLDLASVAQKALEDLLNRKLSPFAAGYSNDTTTVRHTVARISFDLSQRSAPVEQALTQAWRGDLRLAQALANRPGSGVTQTLDLTRDARSHSSYLGARFLSMDFYLKDKSSAGTVVITEGQQSQKLLFDALDQESALFFTTQGYDRTGVVSLKSQEGRLTQASHELWLQLREGDRYTERNQILDHVDPMLAMFLGKQQLAAVSSITDALELYVDGKCPQPPSTSRGDSDDREAETAYRSCLAQLPTDAQVLAYQQQARKAFEGQQAADGLDPSFDSGVAFARKLFELKLAVQSSYQYPALWTGPKSTMVLDFRLTDSALHGLLTTGDAAQRFERTLTDTLELLLVKRNTSPSKQQDQLASLRKSLAGKVAKASGIFRRRAQAYQGLDALARAVSPQGAVVGEHAHLLAVDGDGSLATVSERKAEIAVRLFDELVDLGGMGAPAHQLAGYALLAGVPPSQTELLLSLDFKKSDNVDYPDVRLHGRGQGANLIDAGHYSIKALLGK